MGKISDNISWRKSGGEKFIENLRELRFQQSDRILTCLEKMGFKNTRFIAVTTITIFLASCRAMKDPDYLGIDSFGVNGIGADTSTLAINVKYHNPNKSRLKLKDGEGDAYIDSIYVGHFYMDTVITIERYSDFVIPVLLRADMKTIYRNALSVLFNQEFNVRLEGKCKIGKGGVFFNYPIRYEGKQRLKIR